MSKQGKKILVTHFDDEANTLEWAPNSLYAYISKNGAFNEEPKFEFELSSTSLIGIKIPNINQYVSASLITFEGHSIEYAIGDFNHAEIFVENVISNPDLSADYDTISVILDSSDSIDDDREKGVKIYQKLMEKFPDKKIAKCNFFSTFLSAYPGQIAEALNWNNSNSTVLVKPMHPHEFAKEILKMISVEL